MYNNINTFDHENRLSYPIDSDYDSNFNKLGGEVTNKKFPRFTRAVIIKYIRAFSGMLITYAFLRTIEYLAAAYSRNSRLTPYEFEETAVSIYKRNKWTIFASRASHNIVVAVGGIAGGWFVSNCPPLVLGCWVAAAIVLVAAVAQAAIATWGGSQAANAKRSQNNSYLEKLGYVLSVVDPDVEAYVADKLSSAGLSLVGMTNLTASNLVKRDLFNATNTNNILLNWNSSMGYHIGSHMQQNWNLMLEDIISDNNPGSLESTLRHTKDTSLFKRDGGAFDVEWISINYDEANSDLSREVAEDRQIEEEEYDSYAYDWFDNNHGWKYCIAAEKNDHPGTADTYDDIGSENAFHGELYFNTYGGVDSYCNDAKDGAQCSEVGCGS